MRACLISGAQNCVYNMFLDIIPITSYLTRVILLVIMFFLKKNILGVHATSMYFFK
jgi:hypothetical protein